MRTKKAILALLLCLLTVVTCGCKADISEYADAQILVTGLTDEDFYITPGELAEMECVTDTAVGKSEKAGTVVAYGPTLDTFLAQYGRTKDEFQSIRFTATDEYVTVLGPVTWDKYDVIFSVANGSDPLEEKQQPLRIVIPGADSGKWVRLVTKIEFTENS